VCIQIAERGQYGMDEVVNIVERVLCETHGKGPIRAKMQAIVFKAYRGVV